MLTAGPSRTAPEQPIYRCSATPPRTLNSPPLHLQQHCSRRLACDSTAPVRARLRAQRRRRTRWLAQKAVSDELVMIRARTCSEAGVLQTSSIARASSSSSRCEMAFFALGRFSSRILRQPTCGAWTLKMLISAGGGGLASSAEWAVAERSLLGTCQSSLAMGGWIEIETRSRFSSTGSGSSTSTPTSTSHSYYLSRTIIPPSHSPCEST